ncbi:MAG TPA: type I-E CRISPR-associated protein Cas6/Cse3/CasE, partial [Chitinispirillaceae bacterium]|nr:type I-E CRISPR-associated protein Cas6/Cse3/CasE [Chitinispirillaceae bacterium]
NFLYRSDENSEWPQFFTLSTQKPEDKSGFWEIRTMDFHPQILLGQKLSFSLIANPVISRSTGEFRNTDLSKIRPKTNTKNEKVKRDDIIWLAKQKLKLEGKNYQDEVFLGKLIQDEGQKWLIAKSINKGFEVESVIVDSYRQIQFFKSGITNPVKISTLRFNGILQVTDPNEFFMGVYEKYNDKGEYIAGIGPAKAFGCGLLLIKPCTR